MEQINLRQNANLKANLWILYMKQGMRFENNVVDISNTIISSDWPHNMTNMIIFAQAPITE